VTRSVALAWAVVTVGCSSGVPEDAREPRRGTQPVEPVAVADLGTVEQTPEPQPEPPPAPGQPLDTVARESLLSCWFDSPYSYMFGRTDPVTVGSGSYGMLQAGIRGILYYGDLNTCAGQLVGTRPRSYSDDTPFAELSGLPIHSDRMHEDQPFGFYNPDLVDWGRRNLIPDPTTAIAGVRAQDVYDGIFQRFFRVMAEAYLHLVSSGSYQQDMDAYLSMANDSSTDGIDWLQARYAGVLRNYPAGPDGTTMTAQMAIGFWLRRGIDGTSDELWEALRQVMQTYGGSWYGSVRQRYDAAEW